MENPEVNSLPHYTKILNLGNAYTENALIGEVIIQEKVDGSQFRFGIDSQDNLVIGSKGCILQPVIQKDIKEEDSETIKNRLYNFYIKEILRTSTRGLPEWYKTKLLENLNDN